MASSHANISNKRRTKQDTPGCRRRQSHYPRDTRTSTADLLTVKLLINIIISTPRAKFFTMDIKDFYLNTPMARYKYMRLPMADMPEDVIEQYKLRDIATPYGYLYCKIKKIMYGITQAGIITQQLLK